jgi:hypothetical protein
MRTRAKYLLKFAKNRAKYNPNTAPELWTMAMCAALQEAEWMHQEMHDATREEFADALADLREEVENG